MASSRLCSIPECGKPHLAKGWCEPHYRRWRRHGDPEAGNHSQGTALNFFFNVAVCFNSDECLHWPFTLNTFGYGRVAFEGRTRGAHRMVCEVAHGSPPTPKHEAAHSCGVRDCVNPRHLRWAISKENHADKVLHGTHNRGERHSLVKLSPSDVIAIRQMIGSQRKIAAIFGIDQTTVSQIKLGKRWGHLTS